MATLTDGAVAARGSLSRALPWRVDNAPANDRLSNPLFGVALAGVLCLPLWAGLGLLARGVVAWAAGSG
jgi:hypothetical protein